MTYLTGNSTLIFHKQHLTVSSLYDLELLVQYRREVCKILEAASDYALKADSNGSASDDIVVVTSSAQKTAEENPLHSSVQT